MIIYPKTRSDTPELTLILITNFFYVRLWSQSTVTVRNSDKHGFHKEWKADIQNTSLSLSKTRLCKWLDRPSCFPVHTEIRSFNQVAKDHIPSYSAFCNSHFLKVRLPFERTSRWIYTPIQVPGLTAVKIGVDLLILCVKGYSIQISSIRQPDSVSNEVEDIFQCINCHMNNVHTYFH